jgi:hypothetical protein
MLLLLAVISDYSARERGQPVVGSTFNFPAALPAGNLIIGESRLQGVVTA